MTTPRIEEILKDWKLVRQDEYTLTYRCDEYGEIQVSKALAEYLTIQAHQAGIDEAVEKIEKIICDTQVQSSAGSANITHDLLVEIKALQDNK